MLQAKSNTGVMTTLLTLTKEEIEKIRHNQHFYCPVCNEKVIIRAGTKVIPHFSHTRKSHCPANEGGEGAYHEQGKLKLYQWFQKQKYQVALEAYIPQIKQRPDLLLNINHKKIAIEYQCARISGVELQRRTAGYKKIGIIPLWIIGANHFQRQGRNLLRMNTFFQPFIHKYNKANPLTLYFFDSDTSLITTVKDIWLTKKSQAFGKFSFHPLDSISFKDLFQPFFFQKHVLLHEWKRVKHNFRLAPIKGRYGSDSQWHKWLYQIRMHKELLPSVIHLPVSSQYIMRLPAWDWQSRICLEFLDKLSVGTVFHIRYLLDKYRDFYYPSNHYPLIYSSDNNPICEFLHYLFQVNIIEKVDRHRYQKVRDFHFYKNVEEAIEGDERLLNQLITFQAYNEHES